MAEVRFPAAAAADRPVLVVVHGGFWRPEYDRAHLGPMAEALAGAGWPTVMPEYRREPGRPDLDPARLPAPAGAVRILHGTEDDIVPIGVSECYVRRRPGPVLRPVPAGHFALIDPRSAVWPTVLATLEEFAAPRVRTRSPAGRAAWRRPRSAGA